MKLLLALGFLPALVTPAQTSCSLAASGQGVHICYPSAPSNATAQAIPEIFHLSAQANAPEGQTVTRFLVSLDGRRIYEERLAAPSQQLSIEVNLRSPFSSGTHDLQLTVPGTGSAERKAIPFARADFVDHCNPDIGGITRTCFLMRLGEPLSWAIPPAANYADVLARFDRNLRTLEADASDAIAVDSAGHLYTASHEFSDLELRKYDDHGSLIYDSVVRSCGPGFTAVAALSVDEAGRAWVAANSDACFGPMQHTAVPRGLVFKLDTTRPSSVPPVYAIQASEPGQAIRSLRIDRTGFVYVAGTNPVTRVGFERKFALDGSAAGNSSPKPMLATSGRVLALAMTPKGQIMIVRDRQRLVLTGGTCRITLPDTTEIALQPALDAFVAQNGASPCR